MLDLRNLPKTGNLDEIIERLVDEVERLQGGQFPPPQHPGEREHQQVDDDRAQARQRRR